MSATKLGRYKSAEGKCWIEVRIKDTLQLFDARDPAPFRDRDLDENFVAYITSSARELPLKDPLKIVIYIDNHEIEGLGGGAIREAVQGYFQYQIELKEVDLKTYIKRAQIYLIIGVIVLIACLSAAQNLEISHFLKEGIVIFGWVSMWKPLELILYDWYPLVEKLRFYRKLLSTEIEVHFTNTKK